MFFQTSASVFAEEKTIEEKIAEQKTPITKWINAENDLIEPLSKEQQETFFIIRNKHSVIRTLRVVRDDINKAVKLCAKENDDLKEEINTRFDDWEEAVLPILKEADKFLKTEIKEQSVVKPSEFRSVLKLNDKAYKFSQSKIKKQPVSDEKSCKGLIKSMDKTEDELIALLQNILLPEEVVKERLEQENKT
ncbi:MAG: hypothetical protein AAF988_03755 [Pseudomonadota bacterium]